MRSNQVIVAAALATILVIDYWPFPPWWGLLLWLSAATVAVLWSIGAIQKVRQSPQNGSRRAAIGLLATTVLVIALVILVRPVTRLRIALSASALASEAAAGSLRYRAPMPVGLFAVSEIWVDTDRATFHIGEDDNGWETTLQARVDRLEPDMLRLSGWKWRRGIGCR